MRPGVIHKAACLAKTDLTTELVKEFTELQGIVGGLYARVQQLDTSLPEATRFAIADAIYDHYKPDRPTTTFRDRSKARCFRLATRPTRLPECLPWAWCRADRRIHLRCAARRMGS